MRSGRAGASNYRWNPRVASRTLDGTAFVLLDSHMLSLNGVGTRVWELFEKGATVTNVRGTIVEEYHVSADQAAADVERFVEDLVERGLLVPHG